MKCSNFQRRHEQAQQSKPVAAMTKREFMQMYVLNRCIGHAGGMYGHDVACESKLAWEYIEKEAKK